MNADRIYSSHPLSRRTIVARLRRQGIADANLSEWHLAVDPETGITDQNHNGGVDSVLELAAAARVTSESLVVDVGAGIGGSARVLAQVFGCKVIGVERDAGRYRDSVELTSLVGLAAQVSFQNRDALTGPSGISEADVLWGQSAWIHFPDPDLFIDRWMSAVRQGGRIAMSDSYLLRPPADAGEAELLAELENAWAAYLIPLQRWRGALERNGCSVIHLADLSGELHFYLSSLIRVSSKWPAADVTPEERAGWHSALEALSCGLIGATRLVALLER